MDATGSSSSFYLSCYVLPCKNGARADYMEGECDDDGDNDDHHLFLYLDVELVEKAVSMGEEE